MVDRCLVIGSANNWKEDVEAALDMAPFEHVILVKGIGTIWPGPADAWVTLHNEMIEGFVHKRKEKGYPDVPRIFSWDKPPKIKCITDRTSILFKGQVSSASSGIFAAKVASVDLGYNRVVLCGCPMESEFGRFDYDSRKPWQHASSFAKGFLQAVPAMLSRVRSMSGFTRKHLGAPTVDWLNGMPYTGP